MTVPPHIPLSPSWLRDAHSGLDVAGQFPKAVARKSARPFAVNQKMDKSGASAGHCAAWKIRWEQIA
jgi:hypothetical protein